MANMTPGYFFPPVHGARRSRCVRSPQERLFLAPALVRRILHRALPAPSRPVFVSTLFGGIVVVMSGGLNQHIGTIALQTAACLPIVLYRHAPVSRRTNGLANGNAGCRVCIDRAGVLSSNPDVAFRNCRDLCAPRDPARRSRHRRSRAHATPPPLGNGHRIVSRSRRLLLRSCARPASIGPVLS